MSSDPAQPAEEPSFEQALQELEQVVRKLEEGQLGLSDSLSQYEAGVKRLQQCFAALEKAERRIELLSGEQKAESRSRRRSSKATKPPRTASEDVDDGPGLF
jgi:exodeoxyribonuclease VII small subunit